MIEPLKTHVAIVAMSGSGGPIDITGVTKFYFLSMSFDSTSIKNRFHLAELL